MGWVESPGSKVTLPFLSEQLCWSQVDLINMLEWHLGYHDNSLMLDPGLLLQCKLLGWITTTKEGSVNSVYQPNKMSSFSTLYYRFLKNSKCLTLLI